MECCSKGKTLSACIKPMFKALIITIASLLFVVEALHAEPIVQHLTVVVPQVRPPFDKVFAEVVDGIRAKTDAEVTTISINDKITGSEMEQLLDKQPTADAIIGLGNQAKVLLEPLQNKYPIVYGATFLTPGKDAQNTEGISLTPSPRATFQWLHKIAPEIEYVHVVFDPQHNGWLIDYASKVAADFELTLIPHPVADARASASQFREILNTSNPADHAIWLMQRDPTLDEKAMVPDILSQAWSNNFVVFSSNPAHVPRGALFALYPNNKEMGTSLASLAEDKTNSGITPLEDLQIAVNVRTASHVGINFTRQEEKQFNLIFPNR